MCSLVRNAMILAHVGVCKLSSQLCAPALPAMPSSLGRKSVFFWFASSFVIQATVTSIVLCIMELTLSSMRVMARFVVFSISRRMVMLEAERGISTVFMNVDIKCNMVIPLCRLGR